jgi:hypothetical protein
MFTMLAATACYQLLMVPADKKNGSMNGGDGSPGSEPSLADGTGEGNAPIQGSSASSDPAVLAGTAGDATAASLNDDDYPENIADAAGAVDEGSSGESRPADAPGPAASGDSSTSGQQKLPDQAAAVDMKNRKAIPDK